MARKSNKPTPVGESLTEELAVSLNKKFKKEYNQVAYFLNGEKNRQQMLRRGYLPDVHPWI